MHRSIVVPVDGTPHSERALPYAERLAGATGAALHLVRVMTPESSGAAMATYPHEGTGLPPLAPGPDEGAMSGYLEGIVDRLASHGPLEVDATVLHGPVAPCLARFAEEVEADGVIIATRAAGVLGRMLLGSVADEVVRALDIPVLAVTPDGVDDGGPVSLSPVLLALDGAEESEVVIPVVVRIAKAVGARVTLLHVLPAEGAAGGLPFHLPGDWEREMQAGEKYLDRVQDRLRRRRLRVDTIVMAHPSPAAAICEVAAEIGAGLVALGTHGRSGLSRAILGSVARSVVTDGHRPVLLQRTH